MHCVSHRIPRALWLFLLLPAIALPTSIACASADQAAGEEAPAEAAGAEEGDAAAQLAARWSVSEAAKEAAKAGDWPQFRGPNRDGISGETGLAESWPEAGPPLRWRVPLGAGYAGIVVADDRLFTMFARGEEELLAAFDTADGKELWSLPLGAVFKNSFGDGPRSTPLVDGGRVFAIGARGNLVAADPASGKVLWSKDLVKELGTRVPDWGMAMSPIVDGRKLLLDAGGSGGRSIVALDKTNGELIWASGDGRAGYSAPIIFEAAGVRQAVFFTATEVVSVAPETGEILWTKPWKTSYDVNAATPIFIPPNRLFISSGYDTGAALFEITKKGDGVDATEVWTARGMKNQFSSSVWVKDAIYGFDNKVLKALDPVTGQDLWRERGFSHGSLIWADGHLIIFGEYGNLALAEVSREGFESKATAEPLGKAKSWTVPTLADGYLYLRNEKELASVDLRAR